MAQTNIAPREEEPEPEVDDETSNDTSPTPSASASRYSPSPSPTPPTKKRKATNTTNALDEAFINHLNDMKAIIEAKGAEEKRQDDPSAAFGSMVATQHRMLDPYQKIVFMKGVQAAYMEALNYNITQL